MQEIFTLVQELTRLDEIYYAGNLADYEKQWQIVEQQVQHILPGFTLAYAEIYTAGAGRLAHDGMRHVLLPQQKQGAATPS